jgi:hypothetical protein
MLAVRVAQGAVVDFSFVLNTDAEVAAVGWAQAQAMPGAEVGSVQMARDTERYHVDVSIPLDGDEA